MVLIPHDRGPTPNVWYPTADGIAFIEKMTKQLAAPLLVKAGTE